MAIQISNALFGTIVVKSKFFFKKTSKRGKGVIALFVK